MDLKPNPWCKRNTCRESYWALWSLVLFDPVRRPDPTRIILRGFGPFSPLWNRLWWLGLLLWVNCRVFIKEKNCSCTIVLYFSLIIVKSLKLRRRRQIAEPRKYCLVRLIAFFGVCFLYFFCFSQVGILIKFPTSPSHNIGKLRAMSPIMKLNIYIYIYIYIYIFTMSSNFNPLGARKFWAKSPCYVDIWLGFRICCSLIVFRPLKTIDLT